MKYLKNIVWIRLLAAFLIAFSMWLYVDITTNPNYQVVIDFIVEKPEPSSTIVVVGEDGLERTIMPTIKVLITTSKSTYDLLRPGNNIRAVAECPGIGKGPQTCAVNIIVNDVPGYVRAEPLQKEVTLKFDNIVTKQVSLKRDTSGDTYAVDAYDPQVTVVTPDDGKVNFTGPEDVANTIAEASYKYPLTNQTTDGRRQGIELVPRTATGKVVTGVTLTNSDITIDVQMRPAAKSKRVVVMPQITGAVAPGYQITNIIIEPSTVQVTTDAEKIEAIKDVSTESIDVSNRTDSVDSEYALLKPALGVGVPVVYGIEKVTVRITIQKYNEPIRVKLPVAVTFVDVPDGQVFRTEPATVVLDLQIPPELLTATNSFEAVVSVGAWDPLNPSRQIRVVKAKGVQILNKLPFVTLVAVPLIAPEPTATPEEPQAEGTPTIAVPVSTEPAVSTTPTPVVTQATTTATATVTATATAPTPVPSMTATPAP